MYTILARRQSPKPKDEERRKGLCHLCKRHGHIQRHCPKKLPEQPARARQAILTSLKTHQADTIQRSPSPMKVCTPTPPSTPPPTPMEIDKMYTIPARRRSPSLKDEEKRKGLCHLCKRHGHIQRHCPKKFPEQPARVARMPTIPLVADQGIKRPRSPTPNGDDVLRYLKRTTPENRNEVVAGLMKSTTRQDFSPA